MVFTLKNYFCLFILLAFFIPLGVQAAPKFPALTGRIVDDAHILDQNTVASLTDELSQHEQSSGEQIVVVTVPTLDGYEIEEYGYQLGRAWGIGQKGKDNGALLIVAPKEHKTRIEVGYGLEGRLTDAASSTIINSIMLPDFRAGDYNRGVLDGTRGILSVLGGEAPDTIVSKQKPHSLPLYLTALFAMAGLHPLFFIFLIYFIFFRRRRSGFLAPLIFGSMLGRSGGSNSSGGFGGGFSGGGGGFGGGGASGSW